MPTLSDVHEAMRESILPILLGNTREAHRLSARLFRRYGLVSLICGNQSIRDLFDPSSRTLRFPATDCDRLQVEALIALAEKNTSKILLLIPCSAHARNTVKQFEASLESRFLLMDADAALSDSPLSTMEHALLADAHSPLI